MVFRLLVAALLALLPAPATAVWNALPASTTHDTRIVTTYTQTFAALGDLTPLDVSTCEEQLLVSFDASVGDASADARVTLYACDTLIETTDHCTPIRIPAEGPALQEYSTFPVTFPTKVLTPRAETLATGGDQPLLSVTCVTYGTNPEGAGDAGEMTYAPADPTDWSPPDPDDVGEALDKLADEKVSIADATSVTSGVGAPPATCTPFPSCLYLQTTAGGDVTSVYAAILDEAFGVVGGESEIVYSEKYASVEDAVTACGVGDNSGRCTVQVGMGDQVDAAGFVIGTLDPGLDKSGLSVRGYGSGYTADSCATTVKVTGGTPLNAVELLALKHGRVGDFCIDATGATNGLFIDATGAAASHNLDIENVVIFGHTGCGIKVGLAATDGDIHGIRFHNVRVSGGDYGFCGESSNGKTITFDTSLFQGWNVVGIDVIDGTFYCDQCTLLRQDTGTPTAAVRIGDDAGEVIVDATAEIHGGAGVLALNDGTPTRADMTRISGGWGFGEDDGASDQVGLDFHHGGALDISNWNVGIAATQTGVDVTVQNDTTSGLRFDSVGFRLAGSTSSRTFVATSGDNIVRGGDFGGWCIRSNTAGQIRCLGADAWGIFSDFDGDGARDTGEPLYLPSALGTAEVVGRLQALDRFEFLKTAGLIQSIYVDPTGGSDSNPGTFFAPLAQLDAVQVILGAGVCGVEIVLSPETWAAADFASGLNSIIASCSNPDDVAVLIRSSVPGQKFIFDGTGGTPTGGGIRAAATSDGGWVYVQDAQIGTSAAPFAEDGFDVASFGKEFVLNSVAYTVGDAFQAVTSHNDGMLVAVNFYGASGGVAAHGQAAMPIQDSDILLVNADLVSTGTFADQDIVGVGSTQAAGDVATFTMIGGSLTTTGASGARRGLDVNGNNDSATSKATLVGVNIHLPHAGSDCIRIQADGLTQVMETYLYDVSCSGDGTDAVTGINVGAGNGVGSTNTIVGRNLLFDELSAPIFNHSNTNQGITGTTVDVRGGLLDQDDTVNDFIFGGVNYTGATSLADAQAAAPGDCTTPADSGNWCFFTDIAGTGDFLDSESIGTDGKAWANDAEGVTLLHGMCHIENECWKACDTTYGIDQLDDANIPGSDNNFPITFPSGVLGYQLNGLTLGANDNHCGAF